MNQEQLKRMYVQGYRFQINPKSRSFQPLCVKNAQDYAELCRTTYPNERFDMAIINQDGTLVSSWTT